MGNTIKTVIDKYQRQMTAAGLLRGAEGVKLSPLVAALRPSLTKINRALAENPELLRNLTQPSPFQVLFEYTLPKLESLLVELGEVKANEIVQKLCEHGQKMANEHGIEGAKEHLETLFSDLPNFESVLNRTGMLDKIIENYQWLHFGPNIKNNAGDDQLPIKDPEHYLRQALGDKLQKYSLDQNGQISIELASTARDEDLVHLRRVGNLRAIIMEYCKISDAGLANLASLVNLQGLNMMSAELAGNGLIFLKDLSKLRTLRMPDYKNSFQPYLVHLFGLKSLETLTMGGLNNEGLEMISHLNLKELYIGGTTLDDSSFDCLLRLKRLETLDLIGIKAISDAGFRKLGGMAALRLVRLISGTVSDGTISEMERKNPKLIISRYRLE